MQTQHRPIKTLVSFLLAVFIMFSFAAIGVNAYAETEIFYYYSDVLYNSPVTASSGYDVESLKEFLRSELVKTSASFNVSSYGILEDDIQVIADIIYDELPEAFHVQGLSYGVSMRDGIITTIRPVYNCTSEQYTAMYNQCVTKANEILSGIKGNSSLSDVQKALLIHDRLIVHCEYDMKNLELGTIPASSFTMYGTLVNGIAVCQGYSETYLYLLDQVGIRSYLCESDTLNHAWNIVIIDGNEYHVDVTWDDPTYDVTGRVKHDNFLRSSDGIYSTKHYAYDYITTPVSTTYDSYFWQDSDAEFQLVGNEIYYIDSDNSQIKKYSDKSSIISVEDYWPANGGGYWIGNFSRLSSDSANLYFSSSTSVYKYNLTTGTKTQIWTPVPPSGGNFRIYGFKYADNILYCDLYTTPNFTITTKDTYQQQQSYVPADKVEITGISINSYPTRTVFDLNEICSSYGLSLIVQYSNGSASVIDSGFSVSNPDTSSEGTKTVTVTYNGFSTSYTVTVECQHISVSEYPATESTCTVQGHGAYTVCDICYRIIEGSNSLLPLAAHDYGNNVDELYLVSEADCKSPAKYRKSCNMCGISCDEYFSYGTTTAHNWKAATCTTKKTCSVCYKTEGDELGHYYNSFIEKVPTCVDAGLIKNICARCSYCYTETAPAKGHEEQVVPAVAPTCTQTGLSEGKKCSVCNEELVAQTVVEATGHTPEVIPGKPATETETGLTDGSKCSVCDKILIVQTEIPVLIPEHSHEYVEAITAPTCTEKGYTTYTCACGDTYTANEVEATGHTELIIPAVAPTCTQTGLTEGKKCSVCNTELVAQAVVKATGHTPEVIPGKHATETETGLTEGKKCSVCDEILIPQTEIPKLEPGHTHDYVSVVTAPTCTEKGYTTYTCACGDIYTADEIEATGHTELIIPAVAPTCTQTGLTEGKKCSVCNEELVTQAVVKATGHTPEVIHGKPATETETGLTDGSKCSVCDEILIPQTEIPVLIPEHTHDYISVVTAPTCTEKGYTTYTCACGDTYTANEVEATGHTELIIPAVAPTCTQTGLTEGKKCSVCNTELVAQAVVEATGHTPEVIPGKHATETETGLTDGSKCSVCDEILIPQTEIPVLIPEHTHDYISVVTAPTCTEKGYTTYTCACGDTYTANEVEATGHTELIIPAVAPTCTQTGLTEGKKCAVCNEELVTQAVVKATGHTPEVIPGKHATETQTGLTEGKKCSVCDEILVPQTEIPKVDPGHTHNYMSVTIAPTCTDNGYTEYMCLCGDMYTADVIPATGHTEKIISAVAPTCTQTGLTEGKKCSVCDEIILVQKIVDATGHTEEVVPAVAPTCTANGLTEGKKCSVCNEELVAQTVVEATGHIPEVIPGKPATETETGLTDGEKCSVCGLVTKAQETIPVVEPGHIHKYSAFVTAPTCTENGYTTYRCSCGDSYKSDKTASTGHIPEVLPGKPATETETGLTDGEKCSVCGIIIKAQEETPVIIPEHKHDYVKVVVVPTCTENGYTTYTCSCGDTYTSDEIPATGHAEEKIAGKAPTCTENGFTEGKKCSVCDEILVVQKNIEKTGHKSGDWKVTKAPQPGKTGLEVQNCTVCGKKLAEREVPALESVSDKLEVNDSTVKVDNGNMLSTISIKTKVSSIVKTIKNDKFEIVDKDGNKLHGNAYIGTGAHIQIMDNSGKIINTYTVVVPNDVDGNGKTTAADARLALRGSAKLEKIEGVYATASDVTGDGKVTAADARKILRISAGLEKP